MCIKVFDLVINKHSVMLGLPSCFWFVIASCGVALSVEYDKDCYIWWSVHPYITYDQHCYILCFTPDHKYVPFNVN